MKLIRRIRGWSWQQTNFEESLLRDWGEKKGWEGGGGGIKQKEIYYSSLILMVICFIPPACKPSINFKIANHCFLSLQASDCDHCSLECGNSQLVRWLVLSGTNKLLEGFILLSVLRKHFSYTVRPEDLANDKDESRSGLSCSHRQKVGFDKDTYFKSIFKKQSS